MNNEVTASCQQYSDAAVAGCCPTLRTSLTTVPLRCPTSATLLSYHGDRRSSEAAAASAAAWMLLAAVLQLQNAPERLAAVVAAVRVELRSMSLLSRCFHYYSESVTSLAAQPTSSLAYL